MQKISKWVQYIFNEAKKFLKLKFISILNFKEKWNFIKIKTQSNCILVIIIKWGKKPQQLQVTKNLTVSKKKAADILNDIKPK